MITSIRTLLSCTLALVAIACATYRRPYQVSVLSTSTATIDRGARFHLVIAPDDSSPDATHAAEIVRARLLEAGLVGVTTEDSADIAVTVVAGMSGPNRVRTRYLEPMFRTVSGGTHTETRVTRDKDGKPTVTTVRVPSPPTQELTGWRETCRSDTVYEKSVQVTATARRASNPTDAIVWQATVSTASRDSALAAHVSALANAAIRYLNRSTGRTIATTVDSSGRAFRPGGRTARTGSDQSRPAEGTPGC